MRYRKFLIVVTIVVAGNAFVWIRIAVGAGEREPAVYFLDVGQGDAALIDTGSIRVLIDGGPINARLSEELARIFTFGNRYIDLVVLTHPQTDHFGGLIRILDEYAVGAFIGTGREGNAGTYVALREKIVEKNIPYVSVAEGDAISYGVHRLHVVHPDAASLVSSELNDTSMVAIYEGGGMRVLFTGDIAAHTEALLIEKYDVRADVLKVPHHGSRFSSSEPFLRAVHPALAVIEVGSNSYGHPVPEVLDRLAQAGARILRTDENGTIRVTGIGSTLRVILFDRN
jgi:competence protein ComEC